MTLSIAKYQRSKIESVMMDCDKRLIWWKTASQSSKFTWKLFTVRWKSQQQHGFLKGFGLTCHAHVKNDHNSMANKQLWVKKAYFSTIISIWSTFETSYTFMIILENCPWALFSCLIFNTLKTAARFRHPTRANVPSHFWKFLLKG